MIESNKEYDDLYAMFTECNMVGNPREWWMDSGSTRHVCTNKELFSLFAPAQVEEMLYMANSVTLRNLISVSLLDKNGFKCVTVSGKIVVSKGEMYVGKGYLTEGLYKMNVMTVEMNKSSNSSYLLESYDLWHEFSSEIDSILSNHTWELVNLPPENKPLGSKWIFKRKMKTDGTIDKHKARLVVKGFKQKEGLDYFDTYSPVTRITLIRMLIALAAVYDLQIHQMDVKTAFLNGDLEEKIYMEQPEGFVVPGKENKVCRLIKSLYGLKQAPKQWHAKFNQTMLANGFKINEYDKCVYIKDTPNYQVVVCLYVDDMLIISRDISDINATKRMLERKFDMKDLGIADVILGIRINRTPQGLALSQSHYIKKVLDKFKYMEFGIAKTPLDASFELRKNEGYSDANWITGSNEVKSTSGYVFIIGGGAVSWKSSKQTYIARSTMESEFIALDKAGEEAE
ncbi:hypothetical protein FXO37_10327 [Capsicum annuum]|nr:hypothetical protein FXO37_10327 [Capsicum annuum]